MVERCARQRLKRKHQCPCRHLTRNLPPMSSSASCPRSPGWALSSRCLTSPRCRRCRESRRHRPRCSGILRCTSCWRSCCGGRWDHWASRGDGASCWPSPFPCSTASATNGINRSCQGATPHSGITPSTRSAPRPGSSSSTGFAKPTRCPMTGVEMNATPDHDDRDRFARLVHTIRPGGTLIRAWPLEGGVSAQITAFEIAHPDGHMERMVVRQHGERDREYKPNIATDEFTLLAILGEAGVPAPKPIFVDQASAFFDTPCLVVQYTEGSTGIAPADEQHAGEHMATYLARLHTIDAIAHDLSFLPAVTARLERMLLDPPTADAPSPTAARIRETSCGETVRSWRLSTGRIRPSAIRCSTLPASGWSSSGCSARLRCTASPGTTRP